MPERFTSGAETVKSVAALLVTSATLNTTPPTLPRCEPVFVVPVVVNEAGAVPETVMSPLRLNDWKVPTAPLPPVSRPPFRSSIAPIVTNWLPWESVPPSTTKVTGWGDAVPPSESCCVLVSVAPDWIVTVRATFMLPRAVAVGVGVLELRLRVSVPPDTVTSPVNVLAPESVAVPAPSLTRPPAPVPTLLASDTLPAPPSERPKSEPVIVPALESVSVPESELIREGAARVIRPPKELSLAMFRRAPPEVIPPPESVSGSAPTVIVPESSRAAPSATVVPAAVVPRPAAFAIRRAPPEMVVAPVNVLAPESVRRPPPCFVRPPPVETVSVRRAREMEVSKPLLSRTKPPARMRALDGATVSVMVARRRSVPPLKLMVDPPALPSAMRRAVANTPPLSDSELAPPLP